MDPLHHLQDLPEVFIIIPINGNPFSFVERASSAMSFLSVNLNESRSFVRNRTSASVSCVSSSALRWRISLTVLYDAVIVVGISQMINSPSSSLYQNETLRGPPSVISPHGNYFAWSIALPSPLFAPRSFQECRYPSGSRDIRGEFLFYLVIQKPVPDILPEPQNENLRDTRQQWRLQPRWRPGYFIFVFLHMGHGQLKLFPEIPLSSLRYS